MGFGNSKNELFKRFCCMVNSDGSALIVAVLTLMVTFTLGTALLSVTASNFYMDQAEHDYQAAYYIAEGALRHQLEYMKLQMEDLYEAKVYNSSAQFFSDFEQKLSSKRYALDFGMVNNKPAKALVIIETVTRGEDSWEFKVSVTGSVGRISRTLESTVRIKYVPQSSGSLAALFDHALFANGDIILKGNASVQGDVGINQGKITTSGNSKIEGAQKNNCGLNLPQIEFPSDLEYADEPEIKNKDGIIDGGKKYSKIEINGNKKLVIQLNGDTVIYTDELILSGGSAKIELKGEGRLLFYVGKNLKLDGLINIKELDKKNIEGGDPKKLILIYGGGNSEFGDDQGNGKNQIKAEFYGAIYAPNANFKLNGNCHIEGSLVASTIEMNSGTVIFRKVYDEKHPLPIMDYEDIILGEEVFSIVSYTEK
ncbi:MAG: pilus assembly PilX N-terminal domain-containing protein [Caldicoprobacter oshimai]